GPAGNRRDLCLSALKDFLKETDIICVQETKLSDSEALALSSLPGCIIDYNNLSFGKAGTLIIDTPGLCRFFVGSSVPLPAITKGYIQLRKYVPKDPARSPFQVFNFYLHSGGKFALNSTLLDSLMSVDASVPTFVCGDMNFIEKNSDSTSVNPTLPPKSFLQKW